MKRLKEPCSPFVVLRVGHGPSKLKSNSASKKRMMQLELGVWSGGKLGVLVAQDDGSILNSQLLGLGWTSKGRLTQILGSMYRRVLDS